MINLKNGYGIVSDGKSYTLVQDAIQKSKDGVETSFKNIEKTLKDNGLYEAYDDMVLIKQALIERDRKIYGLQQHNRNLEDKLGRIGGYHYGNPKQ